MHTHVWDQTLSEVDKPLPGKASYVVFDLPYPKAASEFHGFQVNKPNAEPEYYG